MSEDRMRTTYYSWMYRLVFGESNRWGKTWWGLTGLLHSIEFVYELEMDANRAEDGKDLRWRFAYENGYVNEAEFLYSEDKPCTVFEMMVALVVRIEDHIMDDPDIGSRTSKWFWHMIESLGLSECSDDLFDVSAAEDVIFRLLRRDYEPDGRGGLFTIENCVHDLRQVEIWYQAMWYLDNYILRRGHDRLSNDFD